jgi:hypothetical protein
MIKEECGDAATSVDIQVMARHDLASVRASDFFHKGLFALYAVRFVDQNLGVCGDSVARTVGKRPRGNA